MGIINDINNAENFWQNYISEDNKDVAKLATSLKSMGIGRMRAIRIILKGIRDSEKQKAEMIINKVYCPVDEMMGAGSDYGDSANIGMDQKTSEERSDTTGHFEESNKGFSKEIRPDVDSNDVTNKIKVESQGHIEKKNVNEGLSQAKKLYLDTRKIHEPIFDALVKKDPTKHKKYIEWMIRSYIRGHHDLDQYNIIKDFNDLVEKHRIKGEQADINRYKSPEEVYDVVKHFETETKTQTKKLIKNNEAEKVFENDKVIIVKPLSKNASIYYGANTRWCTSASSSYNYFNSYFYNRNVTLYYVISKIPVQKNYEKIAVAVYPDGKKEVYLANDEQVDFENVVDLFKDLGVPI